MYRCVKELIAAHARRPKHRDEELIGTLEKMVDGIRFANPADPETTICYLGGVRMTIAEAAKEMGYA